MALRSPGFSSTLQTMVPSGMTESGSTLPTVSLGNCPPRKCYMQIC